MSRKIKVTDSDCPFAIPNGKIMTVVREVGYGSVHAISPDLPGEWYLQTGAFEYLYEPRPWGDLSPEEKGALLLAHHEGREIECQRPDGSWSLVNPYWTSSATYRVKPTPDTVTQVITTIDGHKIEYETIDGKPDPESIRMTIAS